MSSTDYYQKKIFADFFDIFWIRLYHFLIKSWCLFLSPTQLLSSYLFSFKELLYLPIKWYLFSFGGPKLHNSCTYHVQSCLTDLYSLTISALKSFPLNFFFYLDFLSRPVTNHRTAGEGGGHFFNFSLPLPPASQALRLYQGDNCRELISAHRQQPNSNRQPLVSECESLTTKLRPFKLL